MFMLYQNLDPNINQSLIFPRILIRIIPDIRKFYYFLVRKRTEMGKKSFSFICPKIWQNVPQEFKYYTLNTFKIKLKLHMIAKYLFG